MRTTPTIATVATLLACAIAAPSALAESAKPAKPSKPAPSAERLLRAADTFDRKASGMRTRAARLRAAGLELRREAEALMAGDDDPTVSARQDGDEQPVDDDQPTDDTSSSGDDGAEACAWTGDEELGMGRRGRQDDGDWGTDDDTTQDGETADDPAAEACELIRTAERLEARADALDVAATRMQGHAAKLRAKAATALRSDGKTRPRGLLRSAAKLRASAARLRARADAMRDTAFEGDLVDDEAVTAIRRLELQAAAADVRADRLEARAAKLA